MARQPLVAGNWKMNLLAAEARALAQALAGRAKAGGLAAEMALCPPAVHLRLVAEAIAGSPVALGGQDCHAAENGAHTGDIAAAMLRDAGCTYVILGHSERRADHGETDALVRAKAEAARRAGLVAIVCIGETLAEREAGRALDVVAAQLAGSLPAGARAAETVVAYEPVWAIGTGRTPTPADVAAVHGHIRRGLAGKVDDPAAVRLLYGGSVKPGNAAELMAAGDVDGALVGGASLVADDFWAICEAAGRR